MPPIVVENEMAGDFVADYGAAGAFEPQRVNNFMLDITLPDRLGAGADAAKAIRMSLNAFPFPKRETEATAINYMNSQRKVPGKTTFADADLVVVDYVDAKTAKYLNDWANLVFDATTGLTGLAREVKSEAVLKLFAPNNESPRSWIIVGLWPRVIDNGAGNMDSADINKITVTFAYDYWHEDGLDVTLTATP